MGMLAALPLAAGPGAKNVLVVFSASNRRVYSSLDQLKSELKARVPWPVNLYVEQFDSQRFYDEPSEKGLIETIRNAHGSEPLDLVIVDGYPALQFSIEHRDRLFPRVPLVFYDVDAGSLAGRKMPPGVTGVLAPVDVGATLNLAFRLQPETKTVAVIAGPSEVDQYWLAAVQAELGRTGRKVREIDLSSIPRSQLMEQVAELPPGTLVLFEASPPRESIREGLGDEEIVSWIGERLPTYCIFPVFCVGRGAIGGVGYDGDQQIILAVQLARRVLSGERPEDIPYPTGPGHQARVDWRELRHWKLDESALPQDAIVMYREPTLWDRYRNYVLAGAAAIVLQSLLIIGLLWQRLRKRKAEAELRESERRFRAMADTAPSLIWMCDPAGKVTYQNEQRLSFTGSGPQSGFGDNRQAHIHPAELDLVLNAISQATRARKPFSIEYRLRRQDGTYRWILDVAAPRFDGDGTFAGLIGSGIDVTDLKLAREALEKVSGRLIEAQEEERRRIARELHDDISQKLSLLWIGLEQAQGNPDGLPPAARERIAQAQQQCAELARDVQALSHALHSSKLDLLGMVAAIRTLCGEVAKQHGVKIEFRDHNVPKNLPKDVSLCLFRVTQEALHNALKYSGAKEFGVEVSGTGEAVVLCVRDSGAGFVVEEAMQKGGLGLVSLQERVHLVHGRFAVESRPRAGTKIVASIPVRSGKSEGSPEIGEGQPQSFSARAG